MGGGYFAYLVKVCAICVADSGNIITKPGRFYL